MAFRTPDRPTDRRITPAGEWLATTGAGGPDITGAPTQDQEYAVRLLTPAGVTRIDAVGVEITTAGGLTSVVRLGVRSDSGGFYPGDLLADLGTIDATVLGFAQLATNLVVGPNRVIWLTLACQVAAPPSLRCRGADLLLTQGTTTSTFNPGGYRQVGVAGALPAAWSTTRISTATAPKILARTAA